MDKVDRPVGYRDGQGRYDRLCLQQVTSAEFGSRQFRGDIEGLPGISGASIMGDGGVVLILDPAELMTLAVQEAL